MSKYFPPRYKDAAFNCPHCDVLSKQEWVIFRYLYEKSQHNAPFEGAFCTYCRNFTIWIDKQMIYPRVPNIVSCNEDMPDDCKQLYIEAQNVFQDSPRACAALLRLIIQKLMKHLGEKGRDINSDIGSLVKKGLHEKVQKSLDACRILGNNAVHPGEINLEENPDSVLKLFDLINYIVLDRISRFKEIDQIYNDLPESALAQIAKRDET